MIIEKITNSFKRKFLKYKSEIDGSEIDRLKKIKLQILSDLNF